MPALSPGKPGQTALVGLARLLARVAARELLDQARERDPVAIPSKTEPDNV